MKMYPPSKKTLEDTLIVIEEMKTCVEQQLNTGGFSLFAALSASHRGEVNPSAWLEAYNVIRYALAEQSMYDFSAFNQTKKAHLALLRKVTTILKKVKPYED